LGKTVSALNAVQGSTATLAPLANHATAADPEAWPLWPHAVPGDKAGFYSNESVHHWPAGRVLMNVSSPSMTPFLVDGATTAVIVAPGGAYKWLTWDAEGIDVAQWLNSIGVSAFVLKYRVPFRPWLMQPGYGHTFGAGPLMDAQRAMGLVRSQAATLKLNASRIGFMGFSAGGHLTAHISTSFATRAYPRIDAADDSSCRPDFAMMVYPAYLVNETADDSRLNQIMLNVTSAHPTAFLAQTEDDGIHCENSINYYLALKAANAAPSELHVYPDRNHDAKHGYGRCLRPPIHNNEVCTWPQNAEAFMLRLGVIANGTAAVVA
jgi:acetyl esterase/lipase